METVFGECGAQRKENKAITSWGQRGEGAEEGDRKCSALDFLKYLKDFLYGALRWTRHSG